VATISEITMKKVLLALVMAFGMAAVVGCSGGAATTKPAGGATPAK
jgi:hypothetical protein